VNGLCYRLTFHWVKRYVIWWTKATTNQCNSHITSILHWQKTPSPLIPLILSLFEPSAFLCFIYTQEQQVPWIINCAELKAWTLHINFCHRTDHTILPVPARTIDINYQFNTLSDYKSNLTGARSEAASVLLLSFLHLHLLGEFMYYLLGIALVRLCKLNKQSSDSLNFLITRNWHSIIGSF